MDKGVIQAVGCREGNLKNVDIEIPYGKFTVITGVSGSGKSSFAFDTLYAEGRRQFLEILDVGEAFYLSKTCSPQVDMALGLPPAIAIQQTRHIRNPLSTMGSISHLNAYLFSIFASCGEILCQTCSAKEERRFNLPTAMQCPKCKKPVPHYAPSFFSNQSPNGMCQTCGGSGKIVTVDETLIYPDQDLSIAEGGFMYGAPTKGTTKYRFFENFLAQFGADMHTPIKQFSNELKVALLYGIKKTKKNKLEYPGLVPEILKLHKETSSEKTRQQLAAFMAETECADCNGMGISKEAQNVFIKNNTICDIQQKTAEELYVFFSNLSFGDFRDDLIAIPRRKVLEILESMLKLGIGYLSPIRKTASLSGGEMHRITMSAMLASKLTGILYILDEPSTGLHANEIPNLVKIISQLQHTGNGNTIVAVEHNPAIISAADYVVEFGPGPSRRGGFVIYQGDKNEIKSYPQSVTNQLLTGKLILTRGSNHNPDKSDVFGIRNACSNNLKNVDIDLPLHCLVAITGVSGSGKSSLVFDTLCLETNTKSSKTRSAIQATLVEREKINQIIACTQAPIAKSTRSIVATYTDIYTKIRDLFSKTDAAIKKGLDAGAFSFNTPRGACPTCGGYGYIAPASSFVEEAHILCPACGGKRFKEELLAITYNGKNISDILDMDISESLLFFQGNKTLVRQLSILGEVGLDYLRLGQGLTELSGGEAQRLKLAVDLVSGKCPNSLYIFDEPSAGLHYKDLQRILDLFDKLLAEGHSVIIVEHNIEVIRQVDYVVDMGPGAGEKGGKIIAKGTPFEIAKCNTPTGIALGKAIKDKL
jgi:excinuclease ABC A subunit